MRTVSCPLALVAVLLAPGQPAGANPTDRLAPAARSAPAARAAGAITIDGRLNEEIWTLAPVITDLVQRNPDEGRPATERTEIRLAYDDDALYVGARLFDRQPEAIERRLSRRDAEMSCDVLRVYLDPHHGPPR